MNSTRIVVTPKFNSKPLVDEQGNRIKILGCKQVVG
jgi:hypothetical protein